MIWMGTDSFARSAWPVGGSQHYPVAPCVFQGSKLLIEIVLGAGVQPMSCDSEGLSWVSLRRAAAIPKPVLASMSCYRVAELNQGTLPRSDMPTLTRRRARLPHSGIMMLLMSGAS